MRTYVCTLHILCQTFSKLLYNILSWMLNFNQKLKNRKLSARPTNSFGLSTTENPPCWILNLVLCLWYCEVMGFDFRLVMSGIKNMRWERTTLKRNEVPFPIPSLMYFQESKTKDVVCCCNDLTCKTLRRAMPAQIFHAHVICRYPALFFILFFFPSVVSSTEK